jgi:hypothetical protein
MARSITFSAQIGDTEVEPFFAVEVDFSGSITKTYYTTVMQTGDGNRYALNDTQQYEITVARGNTIKFDQTDSSNTGHQIELNTTEDGTTYTTGFSYSGTAGSTGVATWVVDATAPDELWIACSSHTSMGMKLNIVDAPLRLWTGYGNITIDSQTYIGSGELGSISNIAQSEQLTADGLTLNLSGIPSNLITAALEEAYQNRDVTIYFGCLVDGQLTLTPYELFSGRADQMNIQQSGSTSNITLTVENQLIDMQRSRVLRYTDEQQQALYSSDTSLRYVASLQNKEVLWGVPFSKVPLTVTNTLTAEEAAALIEKGVWKGIY